MDINKIRECISDKLSSVVTHELWGDILQETSPGNYGFEVDSVSVGKNDIWVEIPERTFSFKNLNLQFSARLGASNERDGYDENFEFILSGSGTFSFEKGSQDINVEGVVIKEDLELYGDSASRVRRLP